MKKLSIIFLMALALNASAQNEQKEILEQVWKPYIQANNDLNTDAFMALHSKDVVRASSDNGSVLGYNEYAAIRSSGDQNFKVNKFQKKIELRFTEHWVNAGLAYETGIFKLQTIRASGKTTVAYGRFHVVLRKENGAWKILTDIDSSENNNITEKEFLAARPMEL